MVLQAFESVVTVLERTGISESNLSAAYSELREVSAPSRDTKKLQAEVCFLLARHYRSVGYETETNRYADEAIRLYESLQISTVVDAAPILWQYLPDLMHEGVVRKFLES